ncbi:MAG: hypothetical protein NZV14_08820 [Bryobacteraceae bacterium]|nr:hypothetical protein [Bryobacteraceae bacterium]MDW8378251.1 hypothetical protein [Bryobacterales bacterium]
MQVLQAGSHKLLFLELDPDLVGNIARQAGFESKLTDTRRTLIADLTAIERKVPLLLFDASDPSNLGWFSRCQFYVDAATGNVLQTPLQVANQRDRNGRPLPHTLRLQIFKELPQNFRMPGKQPVTEQVVYSVLYNFLQALIHVGVGLCGSGVVRPLTGRTESANVRN